MRTTLCIRRRVFNVFLFLLLYEVTAQFLHSVYSNRQTEQSFYAFLVIQSHVVICDLGLAYTGSNLALNMPIEATVFLDLHTYIIAVTIRITI